MLGCRLQSGLTCLSTQCVTEGELCTAQAGLKQVGIVGVALTWVPVVFYCVESSECPSHMFRSFVSHPSSQGSLNSHLFTKAIALYSFIVLFLRKDIPNHIPGVIVAAIWLFITCIVGIPSAHFRNEQYYGKNGYCMVNFGLCPSGRWFLNTKGVG